MTGASDKAPDRIAGMFDAIAPRYDLLNRVLSFGIDQRWRRQAIRMLEADPPKRLLDVATGTADLAIMAARRLGAEKVVGVDIAEEMLKVGREKVEQESLSDRIVLQRGDAEKLPFSDKQFDAALVAFGVRHFQDLDRGMAEIRRL